ncbi:hypothetical protein ENSA5_37540 [Enhygromyxa salina]|uniref:Uncharacterized protein n=1 Tax=Enhygromyxa salina TaxID=215803 RepID=A0A2S9XSN6_9BACT|nr:hypothetical protein [Enhygromyxa salina]PRP95884.1 hypothetical protein ENSA5_37540 [Enhygromyxa salina]
MFTKTLVFVLLAGCGVLSNNAPAPEDREPPDQGEEDQHFCCSSIDTQNWTGDGCVAINKENINSCQKVLYCPGKWAKDDGTVTCA